VAFILAGPIPIRASGLALFVLALPLGFVLDFTGYLIVGLFAFWLASTIGLAILYSRLTMLLGGMLMPLEIFPDRWRPILESLPFATVVYGPARMFVAPDAKLLTNVAKVQVASLLVYALAAGVIQHIALKRIQSNGG